MFNPDKQTRAANGKFGSKKLVAEVEDVADAVLEVGREVVEVVEAGYKTINDAINAAKPGEFVEVPSDYFAAGITNKRTGWIILAIGIAVAVAVFMLTGCISVRH